MQLDGKVANQETINELKKFKQAVEGYNPFVIYCNQKGKELIGRCDAEEKQKLQSSLEGILFTFY